MGVTFNSGWAGLALQTSSFNTSAYSKLQFFVRPGAVPLSSIAVSLYNSSGTMLTQRTTQPYATSVGNGWYRVTIPLADLQGVNTTITRVQLQENGGSARPTFHLDNLGFIQ